MKVSFVATGAGGVLPDLNSGGAILAVCGR
jgi:hypothetical protein